jgi:tetratricopeptide (TPR) repeat protein
MPRAHGRSRPSLAASSACHYHSAVHLRKYVCWLVSLATLTGVGDCLGHGDVHGQINRITAELAQTPSNAPLYFQRAELYRIDQDFTNALADLNRAAQIDPSLVRVDFCRGRVLFEAGRPQEALPLLDKYLAGKPDDSEAFTTRGRVLRKLGEFTRAAKDYTTAIAMARISNPELFIERSEALRAAGKPDDAVQSLDEGIRQMGPLVTLQLPAIDLEVSLKRYDAAIARIDAASARLQRKETWLVRRAEVLKQAGREDEARQNYRDALAALDRLPPTHRGTRATRDLEQKIRAALGTANAPTLK